ncbi:unnamed protein product [Oikopleura dioica]|uniref:PDZ domain-containing protein n=1 Tax=Oikopleura dioica TaxID=34765 RepID=E4YHA5_OIKDI|nr:unnamed protein product [Oikopleura dioica]
MEVQLNRKDINERWGITIKENFGATYVAKLVPGTPAGSSGLEIGDVITHVNSKDLRTHGKRQVLEIIRQLRSMSMKFERSKDSSKKPPTEEGAVVFISSSFEEDAATPPKIARKESGKIAKKRGRPAGSTKKGSQFKLVKPITSQPIMKTMLEQLAESSDSENEQSTKNADVELEHQQTRREKLKERKTSTSLKKSKKAKSRTPSITTFDCPPPLEDCNFISPCYVAKSPQIDPYSWEEENPYKQMKNGEAKNNGNTIKITENNPLDHLAQGSKFFRHGTAQTHRHGTARAVPCRAVPTLKVANRHAGTAQLGTARRHGIRRFY